MVLNKLKDLENCNDQRQELYHPTGLLKFCLQFTNFGHEENSSVLVFLFVFWLGLGFFLQLFVT